MKRLRKPAGRDKPSLARIWTSALLACALAFCAGGRGQAQPTGPFLQPSRLLDALSAVSDDELLHPGDADWLMWRRTYDAWGYSPLKQINKANVKNLTLAWSWSLTPGVTETTPLVHDGVLFVHNNGDRIQALDAASGNLLWEYTRKLTQEQMLGSGNQATKRNLAIYGDEIISATADTHLIALNQKTGALIWDVAVASYDKGYRYSGGPMVADGVVIQGMAGCRNFQPGGCFITGHDPATGRELWRLHTVAQDGKEANSWNGAPVEKRQGASAWMSGSYDPQTRTVFYGTGNSYNLSPDIYPPAGKPGGNNDALYTNSTLAIDPHGGKLKWYFQHLQTDLWDLDYAYERMMLDLPLNGVLRKEVVTVGKTGIIEALDRLTGQWLWSRQTVPQNIVQAIDPKTGRKTINPDVFPQKGRPVTYCPADPGGRTWAATAYSPRTQALYLPLNEFCSSNGLKPVANSDGNIGRVDAIRLTDRATLWSDRQRAPMTAAMLPTGGGLVFGGDLNRYFRAYDDETGKILWETRLNSVVNSFPITYSVKGRQYVAVIAASGSSTPRQLGGLTREIPSPPAGSVLWVFALPGK